MRSSRDAGEPADAVLRLQVVEDLRLEIRDTQPYPTARAARANISAPTTGPFRGRVASTRRRASSQPPVALTQYTSSIVGCSRSAAGSFFAMRQSPRAARARARCVRERMALARARKYTWLARLTQPQAVAATRAQDAAGCARCAIGVDAADSRTIRTMRSSSRRGSRRCARARWRIAVMVRRSTPDPVSHPRRRREPSSSVARRGNGLAVNELDPAASDAP